MICIDCEEDLPIHAKGLCNRCYNKMNTKRWGKNNPDKLKKIKRKTYKKNQKKNVDYSRHIRRLNGMLPYTKNKTCGLYLGCHVAERVLSHVFKNVEKMPFNNIGWDFLCNKGKKIDVKSACIHKRKQHSNHWSFRIKKNKLADYFLCLAFDNRADLNALHMWLIPGKDVNNNKQISIATTTLSKWDKYKLEIDDVISCCNEMKK